MVWLLLGSLVAPGAICGPDQAESGALVFFQNTGQYGKGIRFAAAGRDYRVEVSSQEIALTYTEAFGDVDRPFREETGSLILLGAASSPAVDGQGALPQIRSRKNGRTERADVHGFGAVLMRAVYPGVDVLCFGDPKRLVVRFLAADSAALEQIQVGAVRGSLRLDQRGALALRTPIGQILVDVRVRRPDSPDGLADPEGRFTMERGRARYRLSAQRR